MGVHSAEAMEAGRRIANVSSQLIDAVNKGSFKTDVLFLCRSQDVNLSLSGRR